jgi:hypothetical protein
MNDYQAAFQVANAAAATARELFAKAGAEVITARTEVALAQQRLTDVLTDIEPGVMLQALDDAETKLKRTVRMAEVLERRVVAMAAAASRAAGEIHRPELEAGRDARIASAAKADRAKVLLAEAETEHAAATAVVQAAHAAGVPRQFDGALLMQAIRTEADERELWA